LPDFTIHWPLADRPVMRPTWCDHTTTAPTCGPDGRPQDFQLRARLSSGPPPNCVRSHQPHQRAGRAPTPAEAEADALT
jgi:hypothetical protein